MQNYYCQLLTVNLDEIVGGIYQVDTTNCNSVTIINNSTNAFIFINNNPIRPGGSFINTLNFRGNKNELYNGKIIIRKGKTIIGVTTFIVAIIKKIYI